MLEEKSFFTFCDAHFHLVQSGLLMDIKSEFSSAGGNAVFYGCTCAHEREEYESQKKLAAEFSKELKNLDIAYLDPPYNQHPYGSNYFSYFV